MQRFFYTKKVSAAAICALPAEQQIYAEGLKNLFPYKTRTLIGFIYFRPHGEDIKYRTGLFTSRAAPIHRFAALSLLRDAHGGESLCWLAWDPPVVAQIDIFYPVHRMMT